MSTKAQLKSATVAPIANDALASADRSLAFMNISALAYSEALSRDASIANMCNALGDSPTQEEVSAARGKWVIGRSTARMPIIEFPETMRGPNQLAERMEQVRCWKEDCAAPPAEGKEAGRLPKGKTGRRSAIVHKVIRAAEGAATLFLADCGYTEAEGQKAKNDKAANKRGARPEGNNPAPVAPLTSEQLVTGDAPYTAADYVQGMITALNTMVQTDAKRAKLRPIEFGEFAEGLIKLQRVAVAAASAYQLRVDTKDKALVDAETKAAIAEAAGPEPVKAKRVRKAKAPAAPVTAFGEALAKVLENHT